MEALWNFEEKLKISTQEALLLCIFAAFAVSALCTATILKKKARKDQQRLPKHDSMIRRDWSEPASCGYGWVSIKRVLMGSMRWSGANKWEERSINGGRPTPPPLLRLEFDHVGWQSHNSESPVWQRPILMGEKCELPRFSGLILYDEQGQLLHESQKEMSCKEITTHHQGKTAAVVKTTLRDLL